MSSMMYQFSLSQSVLRGELGSSAQLIDIRIMDTGCGTRHRAIFRSWANSVLNCLAP